MPQTMPLVRLVELQHDVRADGELIVAEASKQVPYTIARVFVLRAPAGTVRGRHAHKRCQQFLFCARGAVDIECDDGAARSVFILDRADAGLLVEPGVWVTLRFRSDAVVNVLCDRLYEAEDYIRDYGEFIAAKKGSGR